MLARKNLSQAATIFAYSSTNITDGAKRFFWRRSTKRVEADDLQRCIQNARDEYQQCIDKCTSLMFRSVASGVRAEDPVMQIKAIVGIVGTLSKGERDQQSDNKLGLRESLLRLRYLLLLYSPKQK